MELTKKEMKKQLKLLNKLKKNIEEYQKLQTELQYFRQNEMYWRNTNIYFWNKIREKYAENDLLNCNGDIFYIEEKEKNGDITIYVGRRVLWNLELSTEKYEISEEIERFDDGEIDCENFTINVIDDKL